MYFKYNLHFYIQAMLDIASFARHLSSLMCLICVSYVLLADNTLSLWWGCFTTYVYVNVSYVSPKCLICVSGRPALSFWWGWFSTKQQCAVMDVWSSDLGHKLFLLCQQIQIQTNTNENLHNYIAISFLFDRLTLEKTNDFSNASKYKYRKIQMKIPSNSHFMIVWPWKKKMIFL